jgi:hypothetical protein
MSRATLRRLNLEARAVLPITAARALVDGTAHSKDIRALAQSVSGVEVLDDIAAVSQRREIDANLKAALVIGIAIGQQLGGSR